MPLNFIADQTFHNQDYTEETLPLGKYDNCRFEHCRFGGSSLEGREFSDCTFDNCDLTGVTLGETAFKTVSFQDCKLLALRFEHCRDFLFAIHGKASTFDYSSFVGLNLRQSSFESCTFQEVDFSEASLHKLNLKACDFSRATFQDTDLREVDFFTARNFLINPKENRVKGAIFSQDGLPGLVGSFGIVIR
jgi:fluoroquinolone resistance protein